MFLFDTVQKIAHNKKCGHKNICQSCNQQTGILRFLPTNQSFFAGNVRRCKIIAEVVTILVAEFPFVGFVCQRIICIIGVNGCTNST